MSGLHVGELEKLKPTKLFAATCLKCKSKNVDALYEFNFYGGYTGWDIEFKIKCRDCKNEETVGSEIG